MNGVVFEYNPESSHLSARIAETNDGEPIVIPNWNNRIGFIDHNGKPFNFDGYSLADQSDKKIWGWFVSDIVVLRQGMHVEYDVAKSVSGDIHVRVLDSEYSADVKKLCGRNRIRLWTGEVILKR